MFELDSKTGLHGTLNHWSYPCVMDEEKHIFFVWLGETPLEKFTKTSFLNIVNFAEKAGAK